MSNCPRPNQKTSTNQDDERGAHCFGVACTGYTSAKIVESEYSQMQMLQFAVLPTASGYFTACTDMSPLRP